MARIVGINIPPHQHAEIGLTAIYGIGRARARAILDAAAVPYSKKIKELNDAELERIRELVRHEGARVLDDAEQSYTLELTGAANRLDTFMNRAASHADILAVVRSGPLAVARGVPVLAATT